MGDINDHINVVIGDVFLLDMLTPLIEVKNNLVFEFVYQFDVWVNQIDFKSLLILIPLDLDKHFHNDNFSFNCFSKVNKSEL